MKINGNEAPKGPSPINFQEWTDTRTFSDLKYNWTMHFMFAHGRDKNVNRLHE